MTGQIPDRFKGRSGPDRPAVIRDKMPADGRVSQITWSAEGAIVVRWWRSGPAVDGAPGCGWKAGDVRAGRVGPATLPRKIRDKGIKEHIRLSSNRGRV